MQNVQCRHMKATQTIVRTAIAGFRAILCVSARNLRTVASRGTTVDTDTLSVWLPVLFLLANPLAAGDLMAPAQLEELLNANGLPGAGVCVISGGSSRVFVAGTRKLGTDNRIAASDLFHIGSCTKSMTACLVQMAVQEGRLKWGDTVGDRLPAIAAQASNGLARVTVRDLVSCTSGLPEDRDPEAWPAGLLERLYACNDAPRRGRGRLASAVAGSPERLSRDGEYRYSNIGYCLAGHLLEKAYDLPFEELLSAKLFHPLDLESAGFGAPVWVDPEHQPWGHRQNKPTTADRYADNPLALGPAGTVRMSLEDMGRYLQFVMSKGAAFRFLDLGALLTPDKDGHFLNGWVATRTEWGKGWVFFATGSNTQFFTLFLVAPEIGLGVAVSVNSGDSAASRLAQSVVDQVIAAHKTQAIRSPPRIPPSRAGST